MNAVNISGENVVIISNERYEELIKAETERNIILETAKQAKYDSSIGETVKIILALHLEDDTGTDE